MPEESHVAIRMSRDLLSSPQTSDHFVNGVIQSLIEKSKDREVVLTIRNREGRPFEVITSPGGQVAWGVGGS